MSLGEYASKLTVEPSGSHTECFKVEKGLIVHPFINEMAIGHRTFQMDMAIQALEENTLVVLPTGLGKTIVAALIVAEVLKHGMGDVLFLRTLAIGVYLEMLSSLMTKMGIAHRTYVGDHFEIAFEDEIV